MCPFTEKICQLVLERASSPRSLEEKEKKEIIKIVGERE